MRRKGPLARKTWMRRGPWRRKGAGAKVKKNSYRLRERHQDFMAWVRTQPCIVATMGVTLKDPAKNPQRHVMLCSGDIEADHAGPRALGRKAHDSTCIPLCHNHHDQRTAGWGLFWGYTLGEKRAWKQAAIDHTQARARDQGVTVPVPTP